MKTISFVTRANMGVASYRYRIAVPAQILSEMGYKITVDNKADPEADSVVFSKYWTSNDQAYSQFCRLRGQHVVFDICDDHFEDEYKAHYKIMTRNANTLTVNSEEQRKRVLECTGKNSVIIEDPVTMPEQPFRGGEPSLCWYGNPQNVKGLLEVYPYESSLPIQIAASNLMSFPEDYKRPQISFQQWHPNIIAEFATRHNIALLPYRQGKEAKSANRILEAIQSGMFVMADIIPAAEDIPGVWDLKKGIAGGLERYFSHGEEDVLAGKEYVKKYSPEEIGKQWAAVFGGMDE